MSGDEPRYIDPDHKTPATANNWSQECFKQMNAKHISLPKQELITFYRVMYYHLQESLLFGNLDAAVGMAVAWKKFAELEGKKPAQDIKKKRDLLMAVAIKLCEEAKDEDKEREFSKQIFLQDHKDVKEEAAKWVKGINKNTKHHKDSQNIMITTKLLKEARERFEKIVPGELMRDPLQAGASVNPPLVAQADRIRNHHEKEVSMGYSNPPVLHPTRPSSTPLVNKLPHKKSKLSK